MNKRTKIQRRLLIGILPQESPSIVNLPLFNLSIISLPPHKSSPTGINTSSSPPNPSSSSRSHHQLLLDHRIHSILVCSTNLPNLYSPLILPLLCVPFIVSCCHHHHHYHSSPSTTTTTPTNHYQINTD